MIFGPMFEQFINLSPLSVMSRATIEYALSASALDALFNRTARRGYERELLFSTTVDLMSLVVCGKAPHVQSAYKQIHERVGGVPGSLRTPEITGLSRVKTLANARRAMIRGHHQRVPVTLKSVYEKLQHIETDVSAELVRHVAGRCQGLITELSGECQALLPGHRVRILDGNHLAATQKRLQVTRGHSAGPLPGQSLAVLDPALMLVTAIILCEDGHTQERALIDQVLPLVQAGAVWIEDRNFCTVDFLLEVSQRQAFFVARRHGNMTLEPHGACSPEVETDTGWVSEQTVWICRAEQRVLAARLVRVRLKQPTADGDVAVEILTNLPAEMADAVQVSYLYLKRWKIEGAFHELTMALHCEVDTLG